MLDYSWMNSTVGMGMPHQVNVNTRSSSMLTNSIPPMIGSQRSVASALPSMQQMARNQAAEASAYMNLSSINVPTVPSFGMPQMNGRAFQMPVFQKKELCLMCPYKSARGCHENFSKTRTLYKHLKADHQCDMKCPECGVKTSCMANFVAHVRGHTGERPYSCPLPQCPYRAGIKHNVKIHVCANHGRAMFKHYEDSFLADRTPNHTKRKKTTHHRLRKKSKVHSTMEADDFDLLQKKEPKYVNRACKPPKWSTMINPPMLAMPFDMMMKSPIPNPVLNDVPAASLTQKSPPNRHMFEL